MPKMKTKSSAKKRFRFTGSGKVKCRRAYRNHILTKKSTKRKRKLRIGAVLVPEDQKRVESMMPYA